LKLTTRFGVYAVDRERLECSADPAALRLLAEESGGAVLDPSDPSALPRLLASRQAAEMTPAAMRYLFQNGYLLVALLLWAGVEWFVRRSGGWL